MPQTQEKWFCIGQSGHTADGREIKPEWLTQAAAKYNLATYTARLNVEHYRSLYPGSELSGYGDVLALKTEEDNGTVKLLAQIDPTDKMIELNQKREKIFTSMELDINFANSQEAYLVGLAITDSPASLGCSALKFTASQANPNNFLSEYCEMTEKATTTANTPTIEQTEALNTASATNLFTGLLAKMFGESKVQEATPEPVQDYGNKVKSIEDELQAAAKLFTAQAQTVSQLQTDYDQLAQKFTALTDKLEQLETNPVSGERANHSGGNHGFDY